MQPGVETTNDAYVDADFSVIAPRVAGQIASVAVEDNQTVRKGQVLAQIDDRDYRAAFVAAQADVAMAEAKVENASASIVKQQATIDQASASFAAARANYAFARSDFGIPILRNMARAACKTRSKRARVGASRANAGLAAARQRKAVLQSLRKRADAALDRARAALERAPEPGLDAYRSAHR